MDPEFQAQIDAELTRYEELTTAIEQSEKEVARMMRNYEDILNSYLSAVQIVQPKMDSWRTPRREKLAKMCAKLRQKWTDLKTAVRTDPTLDQDEQLFQAVIRIHYKKTAEQQAFQKKRQRLIMQEIEKLSLPQH